MITEKEAELTIFVAQGEMTAGGILAALFHSLDTGTSRLTLWDLSKASLADMDSDALRTLARRMAQVSMGRRPPGRAAVVCGRLVDFETAHRFATQLATEGYPAQLAPFMSMELAKAWLTNDAPQTGPTS